MYTFMTQGWKYIINKCWYIDAYNLLRWGSSFFFADVMFFTKQEIVNWKVCTSTSPTSEFIVEVKVKVLAPGLTKILLKVTEEVFPGFKFSVCSYVVSLMKANVIRELMLPKFGLEILPLESTFTPLENDYLIRTADSDQT